MLALVLLVILVLVLFAFSFPVPLFLPSPPPRLEEEARQGASSARLLFGMFTDSSLTLTLTQTTHSLSEPTTQSRLKEGRRLRAAEASRRRSSGDLRNSAGHKS